MPTTPPCSPAPVHIDRHKTLSPIAEMEVQETAHSFNKVFRNLMSTVHSETLSASPGGQPPQGSNYCAPKSSRPEKGLPRSHAGRLTGSHAPRPGRP